MVGFWPTIHDFFCCDKENVDGRDKRDHDG